MTSMERDGYGLPTVLKDLAGNHPEVYAAILKSMQSVVPQFRGLHFIKALTTDFRQPVPANAFEFRVLDARLPAARVSDGTILALAILTAAHNPDLPEVILIDDIDHGLHLTAQLQMMKAIRSAMATRPNLQVLCTTHSPYFLHEVAIDEVRVMALDAQGHTIVRSLSEHPDLERWRTAMTAGELWANWGEDWVAGG
jgi:predicted ATPase